MKMDFGHVMYGSCHDGWMSERRAGRPALKESARKISAQKIDVTLFWRHGVMMISLQCRFINKRKQKNHPSTYDFYPPSFVVHR